MKKKVVLILSCILLCVGFVTAQTTQVSGVVVDNAGEPVISASVVVKGTTIGTMTDLEGKFTVNMPQGKNTLVFTLIGMRTVEHRGTQGMRVVMESDDTTLDEVMVVAYGKTKKADFVGSAAVVSTKQIEKRPITNIYGAIEGAAAGVQSTSGNGQPGSAATFRIRGLSSINAGNDPLLIVDGMPYASGSSSINPNDVESITVLKDAASTALYGSRAANGVILITTKSGKFNVGKSNLKVNLKMLVGTVSRGLPEYDLVNNQKQWLPLQWESYRNSLVYTSNKPMAEANKIASGLVSGQSGIMDLLKNNPFNLANNQIMLEDGTINPAAELLYNDFDWEDAMKRTGIRSDYAVSVSDATEKSDYYASIGYTKEEGYVIKTEFERMSALANLNTRPTKWLNVGFNFSGTIANQENRAGDSSTGYTNAFYFTRNIGPIYPVYKHDATTGELIKDGFGQPVYEWDNRGAGASPGRHILAETEWNSNLSRRSVVGTKAFVDITPYKGLTLSIKGGYDYRGNWTESSENPQVGDGAPSGRASRSSSQRDSYTFQQLLAYRVTLDNKHNIFAQLGHESYSEEYKYMYGFKQGQMVSGNSELINYSTINSLYSYTDKYRLEGYFSRLEYNYDSKYYLQGSYRRDGASRFSPDTRWGGFFSAGLSWRISQENFFNVSWVDNLRVRASYGEVGNDNIGSWYAWQALFDISRNGSEAGFIKSSMGNNQLTWETNGQFDAALEFDLFKTRLSGTIEYFYRNTTDLLFSVPLPNSSSGLTSIYKNIGDMYNSGFEIQLNGQIINTNDFKWNLGVNAMTLKNRITKLPQEKISSSPYQFEKGHSRYEYYLRQFVGVNPKNGMSMYIADPELATSENSYDYNGQTVVENPSNALYAYSGSAIADLTGGITNTFNYKDFALTVLCTYGIGGKGYDGVYQSLMASGSSYGTSTHVDMLKRWQKEGDITDVPRRDAGTASSYVSATSTRFLIDRSFFNIKSINLSYSLPKDLLRKITIKDAVVYVSGENLHLFSKRKGYDPQQTISGEVSNDYSFGRVFTFGFNLSF